MINLSTVVDEFLHLIICGFRSQMAKCPIGMTAAMEAIGATPAAAPAAETDESK
jgi:hypothetical protein